MASSGHLLVHFLEDDIAGLGFIDKHLNALSAKRRKIIHNLRPTLLGSIKRLVHLRRQQLQS